MTAMQTIRTYLPHAFLRDAQSGFEAWLGDVEKGDLTGSAAEAITNAYAKITAAPTARRGAGTVVWVDLTPLEAEWVMEEAKYRAEYWLTDEYGPDDVQAYERTAGQAAGRVFRTLKTALGGAR